MKKTLVVLTFVILLMFAGCDTSGEEQEETNYTITFATNGGTDIAAIEIVEGQTMTVPAIPQKEGYAFLGWSLVDTTDAELLTFPYQPESNITLYAQWRINQYTISFQTNGGSDVDPITADFRTVVTPPADPTKEGYDFSGWYSDRELNSLYFFFTMQSQDITLYAKWSVHSYSMSFDTNGGSILDPITQPYDSIVTEPQTPTKDGYDFDGWYADSDLTIPYVFTTMPAEDITLYAKWDELDWSDVELYLTDVLQDEVSSNLTLPTTYLEYSISWESSNPEILSDTGIYTRPYQPTTITLNAIIQLGQQTMTKPFDIDVAGYKSLSAPLTSSYIYRDYNEVTDAFFTTLDIINCAFIHADEYGTLSGTAVLSNINTYIMPKARENGNWVVFSISPSSEWSEIASSASRINTFADNIVDMINAYGFDGVDIDWETPTPSEAPLFTQMMQTIYTKVKANNPNHLVTAAIAGGKWQPPNYDLTNSHPYLDYINMMTYGMVSNNGYYQNALSKSSVFDDPTNLAGKTLTSCSIEESVAIYQTYGIPNSKIIVGVAFYGIKQTRTYDSSSQTWSAWVNAGSVSFTSILNNYLTNSDYIYNYDNDAGVPYIMSTDGSLFISYDNPRSIADKSEYIIANGLAGMMYWENGHDSTGTLLLAMDTGLNNTD